jgi:hypothetical protein
MATSKPSRTKTEGSGWSFRARLFAGILHKPNSCRPLFAQSVGRGQASLFAMLGRAILCRSTIERSQLISLPHKKHIIKNNVTANLTARF